jgi:hypothetical protein
LKDKERRMAKKQIPESVRQQVDAIVEQFNKEQLRSAGVFYIARYRGRYLYLDRSDWGRVNHVCRLEYTGEVDAWDFAIFRYSAERYDDEEWFFPSAGHGDGTVEGAVRAGLEAYPG